jgi:hypothetical protein
MADKKQMREKVNTGIVALTNLPGDMHTTEDRLSSVSDMMPGLSQALKNALEHRQRMHEEITAMLEKPQNTKHPAYKKALRNS